MCSSTVFVSKGVNSLKAWNDISRVSAPHTLVLSTFNQSPGLPRAILTAYL